MQIHVELNSIHNNLLRNVKYSLILIIYSRSLNEKGALEVSDVKSVFSKEAIPCGHFKSLMYNTWTAIV